MQLPDLSLLDTLPKLLKHNAEHWPDDVAMREKDYGIWRTYSWADVLDRVRDLTLGLIAVGVERNDVIGIIGHNRPHWVWAEWAAHSAGAMSLGIYEDSLGKEVSYLLDYGEVKLVFAEDEEQADKLLEIADELPALQWIVYNDERGMRKYDDPRLLSRTQLIERGRKIDTHLFEAAVGEGKGEDVAILCTTSGTTSNPKLAMLQHRPLHGAYRRLSQGRSTRADGRIHLDAAHGLDHGAGLRRDHAAALPHPGELSGRPGNGDA